MVKRQYQLLSDLRLQFGLMSLGDKERDEFSNLVGLYATSQHRDSAPFIKTS